MCGEVGGGRGRGAGDMLLNVTLLARELRVELSQFILLIVLVHNQIGQAYPFELKHDQIGEA